MYKFMFKAVVLCLLGGAGNNACPTYAPTTCIQLDGKPICTSLDKSSSHCGSCNKDCEGYTRCKDSQCVCISAVTGDKTNLCKYTNSAGRSVSVCRNIQNDALACRGCDIMCPPSMTCFLGRCSCPARQTACGLGAASFCVNHETDAANCGWCGLACPGDHVCSKGKCVCDTGKSACPYGPVVNGVQPFTCVDKQSDSTHCGDCWQRCPAGQNCIGGTCSTSMSCPPDLPKLCKVTGAPAMSQCVDTSNNDNHCGDCFKICPADRHCDKGSCVCKTGYVECTAYSTSVSPHKMCVDPMTSNVACGGCPENGGTVCPPTKICKDGSCQCPSNTPTECITASGQTFCYNTMTAKEACGGCFNQCNFKQSCRNGMCT